MMRTTIAAAAFGYALGAALTFNFAHPVDCANEVPMRACIMDNLKDSAVAAVVWPVFWIGEAV